MHSQSPVELLLQEDNDMPKEQSQKETRMKDSQLRTDLLGLIFPSPRKYEPIKSILQITSAVHGFDSTSTVCSSLCLMGFELTHTPLFFCKWLESRHPASLQFPGTEPWPPGPDYIRCKLAAAFCFLAWPELCKTHIT